MRRPLALLLLATGLVVGGRATPAAACSCIQSTPTEALARADVAFVGTFQSTATAPPLAEPSPAEPGEDPDGRASIPQVTHRLSVQRVYRGDVAGEVSIVTPRDGATCGTTFGPGRHLVFASQGQDGLTTSLCSGNIVLGPNDEVPPELGPGEVPEPAADVAPPRDDGVGPDAETATPTVASDASDGGSRSSFALLAAGLGGVLLLGAAGILLWLRSRARPSSTKGSPGSGHTSPA